MSPCLCSLRRDSGSMDEAGHAAGLESLEMAAVSGQSMQLLYHCYLEQMGTTAATQCQILFTR